MTRERLAGWAMVGAFVALCSWNVIGLARHFPELPADVRGQPAPAVEWIPLDPNGPRSAAALRGKIVLIDFWATWCRPCRASMPTVEKLWQRFRDQGLEVVSLNVEGDSARVRAFVDEFRSPLTFPLFVDDGRAQAAYGIEVIPTVVLIDRAGRVRLVHVGEFDEKAIAGAIANLLNE